MERVDVTLTLSLPEELATQARDAGLLTPTEIERWLRTEIERQQRLGRFFDMLDRLQAVEPRITPEEIAEEIETYRSEKRARKSKPGS
jgi:hypothetical protein